MEQEKQDDVNELINNIFKEFNIAVIRYKYSDEYIKEYREANKERIKKSQQEYVARKREQINARHRLYYAKNIDKMRKYLRDRAREKKNENKQKVEIISEIK